VGNGAGRVRTFGVIAVLVIVALVALLGPAGVLAADNTIDFTGQSIGTTLTTQYQSQDLTFGQAYFGADQEQPLTVQASTPPPPTSDAQVAQTVCAVEVCRMTQWIEVYPAVNHVSMQLAAAGTGSASATVTAFDGSGNPVAATTATLQRASFTPISLAAAGNATTIAYLEISANDGAQGEGIAFTELAYGPFGAAATPDFGLVPGFSSGGIGVVAGGGAGAGASITLRRYGGSSGPITFTHGALPAGVGLSISPSPDSGGDLSAATATFTAAANTPGVSQYPVTITGTPSASAGSAPHSITVPITVQATYGLRVQGIEATQGIQTFTLPARNPSNPSAPVSYSGVKLAVGMPTVVRVYIDAPNAPAGGVSGASVQLSGFNANGQPLPGSPLSAQSGPGTLSDSRSATVPLSERTNAAGSYDFTLPMSAPNGWSELASLTATVIPPTPSLVNPAVAVPCTDSGCVALRTFTLNGISLLQLATTPIDLVELSVNGSAPNPFAAFDWASRLLPANVFADDDAGSIDVTWITQGCPTTSFGKNIQACASRGSQNAVALSTVEDFASNYDNGQGPAMAGVTTANWGVEDGNVFDTSNEPVAVVESQRPVTDVMHEIGHMFGLPHAGPECGGGQDSDGDDGGQNGEAWAPDNEGYIDGIGLDVLAAGAPYPVVSGPGGSERSVGSGAGQCSANQNPPECGLPNPQQYFDFMDYCTANDPNLDGTLGTTNAWISVRNWDYILTFSACTFNGGSGSQCQSQANSVKGADAAAAAGQQANAASVSRGTAVVAAAPGSMRVYGYTNSSGTSIAVIDPTTSRRPLAGLRSSFSLALQGPGGRVLARAPMVVTDSHVDGPGGGPFGLLEGAVPERSGVTALAILDKGKVVALRNKPAHGPRVKLLAPRSGHRLSGTRPVVIRWRVSDPDPVRITVSIDFSADNGRTWRTLEVAANTGHASIPRAFFSGSRKARIRLRVNDGFDQVTVTSGRLKLAPVGPHVTITNPTNRAAVRPGATLLLTGVASDDAQRPLTGASLTWLAGKTVLGTGSPLLAMLPAGATSITLVARDRSGRTSRATLPPPVSHAHKPSKRR
jgi:hypothetical protein